MAQCSSYTVRARISAANDDDILVFCRYIISVLQIRIQIAFDCTVQIIHCHMNAIQVTAFHFYVTRFGRAAAQNDSIEAINKLRR
ncbi:hypothetical protein D3C78_1098540 [compost metagenome]